MSFHRPLTVPIYQPFGVQLRNPSRANGGGVPAWVPKDPVAGAAALVLDIANGRGWYNGTVFGVEGDLLQASGGQKSGASYKFGPYDVPGAENLVSNGDFASGTTGWAATAGGGGTPTLAVVDGALEVTLNGANNGGAQSSLPAVLGKGYRLWGRLKKGTNSNNIFLLTDKNSGYTGDTPANNVSFVEQSGYFGAETGMLVRTRAGVNGGAGTYYADDIAVTEAKPFAAFVPGSIALQIEAVAPASLPGSNQVICDWNGANRSEATESARNRVVVVYTTTGHVLVTVRYGNADAASFDLGAVAAGTAFTVNTAMQTNRLVAWLDGGNALLDAVGTLPGATVFHIGKSAYNSDAAFSGQLIKVSVFNGARRPGNLIRTEGDSYVGGAGGASFPLGLMNALSGRQVINTGQGGSEITSVRDRVLLAANADLLRQTTIFWDGSPNGYSAAYTNTLAEAIAALGHGRFVVIPAAVPYGQTYAGSQQEAVANEFMARWPNNFLHWRDFIANTDGTINQDRMLDYPTDTWHLNQVAHDEMGAAAAAFLTARGW